MIYSVAMNYRTIDGYRVKAFSVEATSGPEALGKALLVMGKAANLEYVTDWDVDMDLDRVAKEAYRENGGQKIATIKVVREASGKGIDGYSLLGLKDAKELVERVCLC
jgi:ribosomal protein L7/L12